MSLKELIPLCVNKYILLLKTELNLDEELLYNLWNQASEINLIDNVKNTKSNIKNVKEDQKCEEKTNEESVNENICIYLMKSGKNVGKACGCKVSEKSILKKFCNKHIKEEEKVVKARENNNTIVNNNEETKQDDKNELIKNKVKKEFNNKISPALTNLIEKQKNKLSVVRNKFGNYEHQETQFVYNTQDKMFIGKQNEDGSVSSLTSDDISVCKLYNLKFKIPDNIISKESKDIRSIEEADDLSEEEESSSEEN